MQTIKKIAVIGATGRLGTPVAIELSKTFEVRAIVRSPEKAKAKLPSTIEVVRGDLRDVDSLRTALRGMNGIYLNLATETVDTSLPFYEEREGVKNVITATRGLDIQYISKIGGLGAYPPALAGIQRNLVPNLIRMEGHSLIAASGIPHTFFAPTHFMELLPNMIHKRKLRWIGNTAVKIYWIAASDYARQVALAFQKPESMPEHCPIQGPEAIPVKRAMELFIENYDPGLRINVAPLWVIRMVSIFDKKMKFVGDLFEYFGNHEDPFYAAQTWKDLGRPTTTLEAFAKDLRTRRST